MSREGRASLNKSGNTESRGIEEQGKTNEKKRKMKRVQMASHRRLGHRTSHSLPWTFSSKGITTGGFLLGPANPGKPPIQQPRSRPRGKEERPVHTEGKQDTPPSPRGARRAWGCGSPAGLPGATDPSQSLTRQMPARRPSRLRTVPLSSLSFSLCSQESSKEGLFLCFPTFFYLGKKNENLHKG